MSELTTKIVNVETGQEIERPMNKSELDEVKKRTLELKAEAQAIAEKEAARQSALEKLAALGLTEDEIAALAG